MEERLIKARIRKYCPGLINWDKPNCTKRECECSIEGAPGCVSAICGCLSLSWPHSLSFNPTFREISCISEDPHARISSYNFVQKITCPKTCLSQILGNACTFDTSILSYNLKKKAKKGKCWCSDGSLMKLVFTKDHNVDIDASMNLCSPTGPNPIHIPPQFNISWETPNTNTVSTVFPAYVTVSLICTLVIFLVIGGIYRKFLHPVVLQLFSFIRIVQLSSRDVTRNDNTLISTNDRIYEHRISASSMYPASAILHITTEMENTGSDSSTDYLMPLTKYGTEMFNENLISSKNIKKGKRIGKGQFGEVFKGIYHGPNGDQEVAIKIPKITMTLPRSPLIIESLKSFYAEAKITLGFEHENVLSCIGMSTGPLDEPWMVVEFMSFGDLATVLRTNNGDLSLPCLEYPVLETKDLLHISYQIACGMNYLTKQHFTHRDLAARNCLVGENLLVKISDFGLTRDIYSTEYYEISGTGKLLPIRWMAPESIIHRKFTTKTDVWSYGVLLWEMFTCGKIPYYLMTNKEVMENFAIGLHLTPPEGCPGIIKSLMLSCWKHFPNERNSFSEIIEKLSESNSDKLINHSHPFDRNIMEIQD